MDRTAMQLENIKTSEGRITMKKFPLAIAALFCLSFIITFAFNNQFASASIVKQIDASMAVIQEKLNKEVELKSELAMSSNPYDYIKDNKEFESIVALGNDALPVLQNKIEQSPNDGLQEYILAIAMEKISKTNLKSDSSTEWNSAKLFGEKWKKFLKEIPSKVNEISESSKESNDKINELLKLGTPAIPFIADKVEEGKEDLLPALEELTKDDKELKLEGDASSKKELISKNKEKFEKLKKYVNEQ